MPAISNVTPCCVRNGSSNASSHASSTPWATQYTLHEAGEAAAVRGSRASSVSGGTEATDAPLRRTHMK